MEMLEKYLKESFVGKCIGWTNNSVNKKRVNILLSEVG